MVGPNLNFPDGQTAFMDSFRIAVSGAGATAAAGTVSRVAEAGIGTLEGSFASRSARIFVSSLYDLWNATSAAL